MTKEQFGNVIEALTLAVAQLEALPLEEFLADIERDGAFGCFVDNPMIWSDRRKMMDHLQEMAQAARTLVAKGQGARAQAVRELVKESQRRSPS